MSTYNYARAQLMAHRQIAKYGGGVDTGRLDRAGVLRPCTVAILQYTTQQRDGSMIQFTDERALVSVMGLSIPPDQEQDVLVLGKYVNGVWQQINRCKIVAPPGRLAPAPGIVVFWDLQVRPK
jgi:hypothetical protein